MLLAAFPSSFWRREELGAWAAGHQRTRGDGDFGKALYPSGKSSFIAGSPVPELPYLPRCSGLWQGLPLESGGSTLYATGILTYQTSPPAEGGSMPFRLHLLAFKL